MLISRKHDARDQSSLRTLRRDARIILRTRPGRILFVYARARAGRKHAPHGSRAYNSTALLLYAPGRVSGGGVVGKRLIMTMVHGNGYEYCCCGVCCCAAVPQTIIFYINGVGGKRGEGAVYVIFSAARS